MSTLFLITIALLATVFVEGHASTSFDFFGKFYGQEVFLAHGIRYHADMGGLAEENKGSPTYICGPLASLETKLDAIQKAAADSTSQVIFVTKRQDLGCFASTASQDTVAITIKDDPHWSTNYLPSALKVHSSVLQYFSYITRDASSNSGSTGSVNLVSTFKPTIHRYGGDDNNDAAAAALASRHDEGAEGYLSSLSTFTSAAMIGSSIKEEIHLAKEGSKLSIEFHPLIAAAGSSSASIRDLAKDILSAATSITSIVGLHGRFPLTPGMKTIADRIAVALSSSTASSSSSAHGGFKQQQQQQQTSNRNTGSTTVKDLDQNLEKKNTEDNREKNTEENIDESRERVSRHLLSLGNCKLPASAEIMYQRSSVEISNLQGIDNTCLFGLVQLAALSPKVSRVTVSGRPQLVNFESRGLTQTGKMGEEPYHQAGLTGAGQVCGVADSGANDLTCFLIDDSGAYPSPVTNRTGTLEPHRRKIIQYTGYADSFDDQGGHGTHVCTSIVGNSKSGELSSMNGMAPDGKISFFDLGVTKMDYLRVPPVTDLFESAHKSGARVHSNSWGDPGGIYGQISTDVDQYLSDHPEMLIVYAAGNNGFDGLKSVYAPGNAKNALTVGATQTRTVIDDKGLTTHDEYSRVAGFSSLGPTVDGRIKPDVVAPGDFVMSGYSGPVENMEEALSSGIVTETCGAHQMSGTSMSTPITAGNALLVRQFFVDPQFWASICDKSLPQCFKDGYLTPSGYLLKAIFLHSGEPVKRYSDPAYNSAYNRFSAFELKSQPVDVFQGHGEVHLNNVLPLPNGKGLDPRLNLYVWDELTLIQHETILIKVTIPTSRLTSQYDLPIKVTLCWFDPASPMGSVSSLLLHDIDLAVQGPDGALHWGNAHSSPDPVTSESEDEEIYRQRGNPFGSNSSVPGFIWADEKNPNEQVIIEHPLSICHNARRQQQKQQQNKQQQQHKYSAKSSPSNPNGEDGNFESSSPQGDLCVFSVYLHANTLLATRTRSQNVALVVTTTGQVGTPERMLDWFSDRGSYNPPPPTKPPPTYTGKVLHMDAVLSGAEFINSTTAVDTCSKLNHIDVSLNFKQSSPLASQASPSNIELTLVDASGHAVSVGGSDSSVGIAKLTTEWPDSWQERKSGFYSATLNVGQAGLSASGDWKMYVMNSWSASTKVVYNVTVGLNFEGLPRWATGSSCAPTSAPTASNSAVPTATPNPTAAPTKVPDSFAEYVIPFQDLHLGVVETDEGVYQERLILHEFNFTGHLDSIELVLSGSRNQLPLQGTDAWLFAVAVTDPSGLVAQVGGYKWFKQDSDFYNRMWPGTWVNRASVDGHWQSSRDVHAAGLHNRTAVKQHTAQGHGGGDDNKGAHKQHYPNPKVVNNTTTHPSPAPSKKPSASPSGAPTKSPTNRPTLSPTASPTRTPTVKPTNKARPPWLPGPTTTPTHSPTVLPATASKHAWAPTQTPTRFPTTQPETDKHRHHGPHSSVTMATTAMKDSSSSSSSTNEASESETTTITTARRSLRAFKAEEGAGNAFALHTAANHHARNEKEVEGKDKAAVENLLEPWSVVVAMGYPWSARRAANYTGKIVLHFSHTVLNGTIYAPLKVGKQASVPVPSKDKDGGGSADTDDADTGYGARDNDDEHDTNDSGNKNHHKKHLWKWLAAHTPSAKASIAFIAVLIIVATMSICIQSSFCQPNSHGTWVVLNSIFPGLSRSLQANSTRSEKEGYTGLIETPPLKVANKPRIGQQPFSSSSPSSTSTAPQVPGIKLQLLQPKTQPQVLAAAPSDHHHHHSPQHEEEEEEEEEGLTRRNSRSCNDSEGGGSARIYSDDFDHVASGASVLDDVNISDVGDRDRRGSIFAAENPMGMAGRGGVASIRLGLSDVWHRLASSPAASTAASVSAESPTSPVLVRRRDAGHPMAAGGGITSIGGSPFAIGILGGNVSESSSLLYVEDDDAVSVNSGVDSLLGGKRRKKKSNNSKNKTKVGKSYGSLDKP